jgi:hypothetical protein
MTLASVAAVIPAAQAQDFFSQLFGGFGRSIVAADDPGAVQR